MLFLIYIIIGLIINGIALVLNWKYKWITRDWIETHDIEFMIVVLCAVIWPFGVAYLILLAIMMFIHRFFLPE